MQIVNAAKTTVVKYYYDAWGYNFATEGPLASTVGAINPIRYRSYYYDTGTGIYFLRSRYYDPTIRRFISPDKLLDAQSYDGFNLFAYCGNNPVKHCDSTGFVPVDIVTGKKTGVYRTLQEYDASFFVSTTIKNEPLRQVGTDDKHLITTIGIAGNAACGVSGSYNGSFAIDVDGNGIYAVGGIGIGGGGVGVTPVALSIGFFNVNSIESLKNMTFAFSASISFCWFPAYSRSRR